MKLSIEEVQCFQAVMNLGSINAASSELNKAKSAVSYSINKLEEQLGFMLFQRGKYRLEATRKGKEFFEKSFRLIEEAHRLETFAEQMKSGVELSLSLSASVLFPLSKVSAVLKAVSDKFRETELKFQREVMSGHDLLDQGKVDLAIFEAERKNENFEYKELMQIDLKLSIASHHPFLQLPPSEQTVDNLVKYPQIIQRSTVPSEIDAGVYRDSVKWYVTDINTKKSLIADGLGWGRLPIHETSSLVEQGKITYLTNLEEKETVTVYLGRRLKWNHGEVSNFIWNNI